MNKKVKEKWIKALRSGKYKQTRMGVLRTKRNAFCCLGVLCDVVDPKSWQKKDSNAYDDHYSHQGHDTWPTNSITGKLGITPDTVITLVKLNDDAHYSFNKIADWVEKNL